MHEIISAQAIVKDTRSSAYRSHCAPANFAYTCLNRLQKQAHSVTSRTIYHLGRAIPVMALP